MLVETHHPAIMLLGQDFGSENPISTVLRKVGYTNHEFDLLLDTLEHAASLTERRCLLTIDAINEAVDLKVLVNALNEISYKVLSRPHLAFAITIRAEYKQILPAAVIDKAICVFCEGFTTPEEIEAASKQYLEKRGITRPSVPWLPIEFSNPLFLRTCCISLHHAGKTEFPDGLRGIHSILRFYLNSLESHLRFKYPSAFIRQGALFVLVREFASAMAQCRRDYVQQSEAFQIFEDVLKSKGPSAAATWYQVFTAEGLLRKDLQFPDNDDMEAPEGVIRFSYQKFTDHLLVSALLENTDSAKDLFLFDGPLSFMLENNHISWEWRRLLSPIAIQIPEHFHNFELPDLLNSFLDEWWQHEELVTAFSESICWRSHDAFSARTLELFDELRNAYEDLRLPTLLQVAVVETHPWNALFLHSILVPMAMPDRDVSWSIPLAEETNTRGYPIHRLIDWALRGDIGKSPEIILELTSIVLCWALSAPSRHLRDHATKALSKILINRPILFERILVHFNSVDDMYIHERIMGAAFGAAVNGIERSHLRHYAEITYTHVFENDSPPVNLLLRDYALAIIEFVDHLDLLPTNFALQKCKPPYKSVWPLEAVDPDVLKERRDRLGDYSIYRSLLGDIGDFGKYTVSGRIRHFSSELRTSPIPLTIEEKLRAFEAAIDGWTEKDKRAFSELKTQREKLDSDISRFLNTIMSMTEFTDELKMKMEHEAAEEERQKELFRSKWKEFEESLGSVELHLFQELAAPYLDLHKKVYQKRLPPFPVHVVKLWIVDKAYDLGWTRELFGDDRGIGSGRGRKEVERIGKKYQWIALSEVLARLSDNVWMSEPEGKVYSRRTEISFCVDLEPTILCASKSRIEGQDEATWWAPKPVLSAVSDDALEDWCLGSFDINNGSHLVDLSDPATGQGWLVLYSSASNNEPKSDGESEWDYQRTSWYRVSSIIVSKDEAEVVFERLQKEVLTDPTAWSPKEVVDEGFYFEYPWRSTWTDDDSEQFEVPYGKLEGLSFRKTCLLHQWESHLDATLPDGSLVAMPEVWLAKNLDLSPSTSHFGCFVDKHDKCVFKDPSVGTSVSSAAIIDENIFLSFLESEKLTCFWIISGEKIADSNSKGGFRGRLTHSGIYRFVNGKLVGTYWTSKDV